MDKKIFINSNSSIPNRRKITIVSKNSENEIIADIEHLDENRDGTAITQKIYQDWEDNIQNLYEILDEAKRIKS